MPPFRGLGSSPPGVRKDGHQSIAGKSVLGSSHPQGRGKGSRGFGVGGKGQKRHRYIHLSDPTVALSNRAQESETDADMSSI
ncbi:hypothetical protein CJF30_00006517 [Rutstroemia sp. NJR-2017a BBW]|nr:hypothetical protein CJF30_00006517 [Rutstroemia sp. NJR-2017a BBW]